MTTMASALAPRWGYAAPPSEAMRPYMNFCLNTSADLDPSSARPLIRVVLKELLPFLKVDNEHNPRSVCGPMAYLLSDFVEAFGLRFVLVPPVDGDMGPSSSGSKQSDGRWNGILGMLQRHEADVSLFPMTATMSRLQAARFSAPIGSTHYAILTRSVRAVTSASTLGIGQWYDDGSSSADDDTVFGLRCFLDPTVIFGVVMSIAMMTLANVVVSFFSDDDKRSTVILTYARACTDAIRESKDEIIRHVLRPKTVLWVALSFLTSFAMVRFFGVETMLGPDDPTGVGLVSLSRLEVNTVHDLLDRHSEMTPVAPQSGALRDFLKVDPLKRYPALHRRIKEAGGFFPVADRSELEAVAEDVAAGRKALIMTVHALDQLRSAFGPCRFHIGREKILPAPHVLAFTRTFPSKHIEWINARLKSYEESGLLKEWKRELALSSGAAGNKSCARGSHHVTTRDSLRVQDLKGLFVVLIIGWAMAVSSLLSEMLFSCGHDDQQDDDQDDHTVCATIELAEDDCVEGQCDGEEDDHQQQQQPEGGGDE